jgi:hypothetical protein
MVMMQQVKDAMLFSMFSSAMRYQKLLPSVHADHLAVHMHDGACMHAQALTLLPPVLLVFNTDIACTVLPCCL